MQNKGKQSLPVYIFFQLFHLQLILFWLLPSGFFFLCRASRNSLQEPFFTKSFWLSGRKTKALATDRKKTILRLRRSYICIWILGYFHWITGNCFEQWILGSLLDAYTNLAVLVFAAYIVFIINSLIWNYFLFLIETRVWPTKKSHWKKP